MACTVDDSALARFISARVLARSGEGAAAIARLGPDAAESPMLPVRLLLAELRLDAGQAEMALALVRGALATAPAQPIAVQHLIEASHALGRPLSTQDTQLVQRSCQAAAGRVPTLDATCRLHRGLLARRAGQRYQAEREALAAAELAPGEPRVLGTLAQLLVNTGSTVEAKVLIRRAARLADPRLPPLAWAQAGAALATDRRTTVPDGPPPGPEARLIAARASFVGPRIPPAAVPLLGSSGATGARGDRDLRWVADGARVKGGRAARLVASRLRAKYGARPPGPVASFVAGTLARRGGHKPLARTWLSQSLKGHGDACRAASLYRLSLSEQGRNPLRNARLQRAIGKLGCNRKH